MIWFQLNRIDRSLIRGKLKLNEIDYFDSCNDLNPIKCNWIKRLKWNWTFLVDLWVGTASAASAASPAVRRGAVLCRVTWRHRYSFVSLHSCNYCRTSCDYERRRRQQQSTSLTAVPHPSTTTTTTTATTTSKRCIFITLPLRRPSLAQFRLTFIDLN